MPRSKTVLPIWRPKNRFNKKLFPIFFLVITLWSKRKVFANFQKKKKLYISLHPNEGIPGWCRTSACWGRAPAPVTRSVSTPPAASPAPAPRGTSSAQQVPLAEQRKSDQFVKYFSLHKNY